jgi:hypothetical protein
MHPSKRKGDRNIPFVDFTKGTATYLTQEELAAWAMKPKNYIASSSGSAPRCTCFEAGRNPECPYHGQ